MPHLVKIVIDSREASKARKVVEWIRDLGARIEIRKLEVGDYVVSEDVGIERKTISDFVGTLTRRDLFEQLFALKEVYPKPVLVLEGNLAYLSKYSRINFNSVLGALAAVARSGVAVIPTPSCEETAKLLYFMARQEQVEEKKAPSVRPVKKFSSLEEEQIFFLAGLPQIGRERAISILKAFGNPLNALNNYRLWSKRVEGIGESIVRRVEEVLTKDFKKERRSGELLP